LFAQNILTVADLTLLEEFCAIHGDIQDMRSRHVPVTTAIRNQYRLYAAEFGISPSSRTRVGKNAQGGKKNKFDSNGKKET
jgi:phage terminase small subunit